MTFYNTNDLHLFLQSAKIRCINHYLPLGISITRFFFRMHSTNQIYIMNCETQSTNINNNEKTIQFCEDKVKENQITRFSGFSSVCYFSSKVKNILRSFFSLPTTQMPLTYCWNVKWKKSANQENINQLK